MRPFLLILIFAVTASVQQITNAHAASSDWHDLGGGEARLVAMLDPVTEKVSGIVEVRLKPGWSTYWRYPGSTGIPPEFDFSQSTGFRFDDVEFPAPKHIKHKYGSYAGYKDRVAFPFQGSFEGDADGVITLNLLIGVCEEICIPAQAEISVEMAQLMQSDPAAQQAISFAKVLVPKWTEAENLVLDVTTTGKNKLHIKTAHPSRFGKPDLFVEGPANWYLKPANLLSQTDNTALFELDLSRIPDNINPMKEKLRYTLVSGQKGIETAR